MTFSLHFHSRVKLTGEHHLCYINLQGGGLQIHDIFLVFFFTLITLNKVSRRSFIRKEYLEVFFLDFQTLKRVNLTRNITGGLSWHVYGI